MELPDTLPNLLGLRFTVLRRTGSEWLDPEVKALLGFYQVFLDSRFKRDLIILGEQSREKIQALLPGKTFQFRIVEGRHPARLPFRPPIPQKTTLPQP